MILRWVLGAGIALAAATQANSQAAMPLSPEVRQEIELLRARLAQLWNPPTGAADPKEITIDIEFKLKPDGMLAGPPVVLTRGDSPLFKTARQNAAAAIFRGQPYDMLKPEYYEVWKDIVITFDPRYVPSR